MRRCWTLVRLAVLGCAFLTFVAVSLAASERPAPLLQQPEQEPNNDFSTANSVALGSVSGVVTHTTDMRDYFVFPTTVGRRYRASLTMVWNPAVLQLRLRVYNAPGEEMPGSPSTPSASYTSFEWTAGQATQYVMVELMSPSTTTLLVAHYWLDIVALAATPTPTSLPTVTPTPVPPVPGADSCENNYDFEHACVIPANQSQTFNFIPVWGGVDNDFFKIWVKPGLMLECRTSDLAPGVDPNMIVYDRNRNALGGNDDVAPGDFNSAFSYYATYEGWVYLLLGTGERTPSNIMNSSYTLRCDLRPPGQPTATPPAVPPTAPPAAPPTQPPPAATPTLSSGLSVRLLTTPTPSPPQTPVPRFVSIRLLAYYDGNGDGQPGAGEGIRGVPVYAYDALSAQVLAQGFTDDRGHLEFSIAVAAPVRISVPFFGFSQLVTSEAASVYLRVPPQPSLGGTP